jgi:exopolysaccharide biosynthesis polyprenyl glycosylphosphotransferase
MDMLREYEATLLVENPEPERASSNGFSHTNGHVSGNSGKNGSNGFHPARPTHEPVSLPDKPIAMTPSGKDSLAPERFRRNFADPLFPCKNVPYATAKRIFDVIVALVAIALASPIIIVTALLVKLTSRGPVLFKQVRVGAGGRYFWCYKFRSMCVDAEQKKEQLMHLNEVSGPVFKIKNDPRVTPIGSFIRKYSIDELPQFFNVLQGDMSIVGPRPPIPSEVDKYTPHERGRLAVKPGLTCLWQVNGRSNVSFERWVQLDLDYIDTMSLKNDFKILWQTIPAVLRGSGAH